MDGRLASVVLSDALREKIKSGAQVPPRRSRPVRFRRLALTALAACLVLMLGLGVAAGVFPYFERFIERMGEDLRDVVQPLGEASVQQGIRMELLAAVHDGGNAIVYLALTDEAGARIDESTQLNHIEMQPEGFLHASQVDFDAVNRTAVFRLETAIFNETDMAGEPLELTVHSILTGVTHYEALDTGLTVADIAAANPEPEVYYEKKEGSYGISHGANAEVAEAIDAALAAGTMPLLVRNSAPVQLSAPYWVEAGAAGVIDGMLHLQYEPVGDAGRYGYTSFYLEYPGVGDDPYYGSPLTSAYINLGKASTEGYRDYYEYSEDILELPAGVPTSEVRLMATGMGCDESIEGAWCVGFTLDERPAQLVSADALGIDLNGWSVERIAVSSIGITALCAGEQTLESDSLLMEAFLADGTPVKTYSASIGGTPDGRTVSKVSFARPVKLEDIAELRVNGEAIALHPEA